MRLSLAVSCALAASLAASQALACSPAENDSRETIRGDACAVEHFPVIGSEGLDAAEDLGNGFVHQTYFSGTACGVWFSMVVVDCASRTALVIGPQTFQPMWPTTNEIAEQYENQPFFGFREKARTLVKSGRIAQLEEIQAMAPEHYINDAIVSIRRSIGISNSAHGPSYGYDLGCGCRLYYPGGVVRGG